QGYNGVWTHSVKGLFYGGGLSQFWAQLIEAVVCIGWNVVVGGLIFFIVGKLLGSNRVPAKVEIAGLDIPEMGALGYPEFMDHLLPEDISDAEVEEIASGAKLEPSRTRESALV